jgi:transmembrane sensor
MKNDILTEILLKYFNGSASKEEENIILEWSRIPENKKVFDELKEIWTISGTVPEDFDLNIEKAWEKVSTEIDKREKVIPYKGNNFKYYFSKIAAVFIISVSIYFIYEMTISKDLKFEKVFTKDNIKEFVLPDSSKVWLNNNTALEYVENFEGDNRLVKLDGEAYFEVTENPKKPFVIEALSSQVEVLGTSFNFRAYGAETKNTLAVKSGKVLFSNIRSSEKIIIEEGELAVLHKGRNEIRKSINTDKNYLAWITGKLMFEDEQFEIIIKYISKYYSYPMVIVNPEIRQTRLTISFDNLEIDEALKVLEMTMNVKIRKDSDTIFIN